VALCSAALAADVADAASRGARRLIGYPARIFLFTHVLLYHALVYPDCADVVAPGPKCPVLARNLPGIQDLLRTIRPNDSLC